MSAFRFTVDQFAELPKAFTEEVHGSDKHRGILVARISPKNNRPMGDVNLLARALVWFPADECMSGDKPRTLARLAIYVDQLRDSSDPAKDPDTAVSAVRMNRRINREVLEDVLRLPILELVSTLDMQ